MYQKAFLVTVFGVSMAEAGNGFTSQFSHFMGGLLMVFLVAYIVKKFFSSYAEKAVLIGFGLSIFYVGIDQTLDYMEYGKPLNQLYDFASHALGALIALWSGRYLFKK
ncbi:MAG: hypothetical protein RL113_840 [Pseudomonadota bacterium]|jgi:putative Mn2+ efflux pump MntP